MLASPRAQMMHWGFDLWHNGEPQTGGMSQLVSEDTCQS